MTRRRPAPLVGNSRVLQNNFQIHFNADVNDSMHTIATRMQCRICKHYESQPDKLINPCFCTHQNKYVHERCLLKWLVEEVMQSHARGEDISSNLKCELCNQPYKVKYQTHRRCSCNVVCRVVKERGCPGILWPILLFAIILAILTPTTVLSLTGVRDSPLYIPSETGQYVALGLTILCCLLLIVLLVVYLHNNLTYIEIVLEKAYNFDDDVSEGSKTSSSEEGRLDGGQMFVVTWLERDHHN